MAMTKVIGVPDKSAAKPGMAFFEGTGPAGKTCGDCTHRGYWPTPDKRVLKCAMFRKQAGHDSPAAVAAGWRACKFFEQKAKER